MYTKRTVPSVYTNHQNNSAKIRETCGICATKKSLPAALLQEEALYVKVHNTVGSSTSEVWRCNPLCT